VERGELWWALVDERCPVVLLTGGATEFRAMRIVPPATVEQKRGYVVLTAAEAAGYRPSGAEIVGIEVAVGPGVVRVALPRAGHIFCTWLVTLTPADLIEPIGALTAPALAELTGALRLAGVE
jgi:mRNA interferase MazF